MDSGTKTAIILGIGITVAIAGISFGFSSLEETAFEPATVQDENGVLQVTNIDKSKFKKAPNLVGIANFINTTPEKLKEEIKGKIVLYDIWTYSCINCIRTLPYITAWDDKYSDEGLLIVGIHSPEFEFEKQLHNVEMAVEKYGINYPVVLDNDWETWKAFENRYWPRKYIADHEGYIRYDHIGEGAYQETEKIIQDLLMERAVSLGIQMASAESFVDIQEFEHSNFRTPELYFGYKFAQSRNQLGSSEGFIPNTEVSYTIPERLNQHYFYLEGTWLNLEGGMKLISDTGRIKVLYNAKEVNIVAGNNAELEIYLDDKPVPSNYAGKDIVNQNNVMTDQPRLYNIINSHEPSSHILDIVVSEPGFEIYTFTFG